MHRVGFGKRIHYNCMPGFVVGHDALFFLADQTALAFWSSDDTFDRFFEFRLANDFFVAARSQNGRFIDQIFKVCTYKAGAGPRQYA